MGFELRYYIANTKWKQVRRDKKLKVAQNVPKHILDTFGTFKILQDFFKAVFTGNYLETWHPN